MLIRVPDTAGKGAFLSIDPDLGELGQLLHQVPEVGVSMLKIDRSLSLAWLRTLHDWADHGPDRGKQFNHRVKVTRDRINPIIELSTLGVACSRTLDCRQAEALGVDLGGDIQLLAQCLSVGLGLVPRSRLPSKEEDMPTPA